MNISVQAEKSRPCACKMGGPTNDPLATGAQYIRDEPRDRDARERVGHPHVDLFPSPRLLGGE